MDELTQLRTQRFFVMSYISWNCEHLQLCDELTQLRTQRFFVMSCISWNCEHLQLCDELTQLRTQRFFVMSFVSWSCEHLQLCVVTDLHWGPVVYFVDGVTSRGSSSQDGGQNLQSYRKEVSPRRWDDALQQ
jgi:hypothetical protein